MSEHKNPKVGDILRCSWGYDQTNVDWYEVIKVTPGGVRIRAIATKHTDSDRVMPVKGSFLPATSFRGKDALYSEKGAFKKVHKNGRDDGYSVTISSYSSAYLWDGVPAYETPFNCGH